MGISVIKNSDTNLTVTFTGNAASHTDAIDLNNAIITVAQSKITRQLKIYPQTHSPLILSPPYPTISMNFAVISEPGENNGSIKDVKVVRVVNGTFAVDMSSGVTVNSLPQCDII